MAKAVEEYIGDTKVYEVQKTDVVKGGGIVAEVDGYRVAVGNVSLMGQENVHLNESLFSLTYYYNKMKKESE